MPCGAPAPKVVVEMSPPEVVVRQAAVTQAVAVEKCGFFKRCGHFCRQPIYVAFAMTLWTVPVWTPDQLELAVVLTLYCVTGPLLKERRFSRRFGEQFRAYQSRVPYWLPLCRTRTPPARPGDL